MNENTKNNYVTTSERDALQTKNEWMEAVAAVVAQRKDRCMAQCSISKRLRTVFFTMRDETTNRMKRANEKFCFFVLRHAMDRPNSLKNQMNSTWTEWRLSPSNLHFALVSSCSRFIWQHRAHTRAHTHTHTITQSSGNTIYKVNYWSLNWQKW